MIFYILTSANPEINFIVNVKLLNYLYITLSMVFEQVVFKFDTPHVINDVT